MKFYKNTKYYLLNLSVLIALSIFIGDLFIMPMYVRHGEGSYMVNVKEKPIDYAIDKLIKGKMVKLLDPEKNFYNFDTAIIDFSVQLAFLCPLFLEYITDYL